MRILLIYNSHAGGGRGRKMLPEVKKRFAAHDCEMDLRLTRHTGHGISLVQEADLSLYDGVVATGGDGTVHEVITGHYRNPGPEKPPVGIVPVGTGNAFVREMDLLGSDWARAVDIVVRAGTRRVDVSRFTTGDEVRYSLNILGVGFVSDVSETATRLKFLGNNAYLLGTFYRLLRLRFHDLRITCDEGEDSVEALFATVSNSRYTGTTFLIAPEAKVDDGLLDLVVVKKISRLRLLSVFKTIFTGAHLREPEVVFRQVSRVRVESAEPRSLNVDGEVMGRTPLVVECLPGDLSVFWPCNS